MKFLELKTKAYQFYPAILVDKYGTHISRRRIRLTIFYFLVLFFLLMTLQPFVGLSFLDNFLYQIRGIFFLIFILWLSLYLLETMYLSYYFKDSTLDFSVAKIVLETPDDDITGGFIASRIGQYSMLRLGIKSSDLIYFLKNRNDFVSSMEYMIIPKEGNDYISVAEYGRALLHFDSDLKKFLNERGITPEIFYGAISWVAQNNVKYRENERWWTKDNLSRIPSLGKNWSFGQIYLLEKYGHPIFAEQSYQYLGDKYKLQTKNVNKIEQILVKETGANIMLISEDHATAMEVISSFAKEIVNGTVLPELESKRVFVLDGASVIDSVGQKTEIETLFHNILAQTANAGNVILVIPNMSSFSASAQSLKVDIADILEEALGSSRLQIVAVSSNRDFHNTLETNIDLMRHFEKVIIERLDEEGTVGMLEDQANLLESQHDIFFTYQSLIAITESADRYFAEGILSDKATDLLFEITPKLISSGKSLVTQEDVEELVEMKTGIPQGEIKEDEKEKLLLLEEILHKRVVGQKYAINAIAVALKRARAGITNPKRPLGSFIFLGPTGVGKTETAKALAETYFGSEEKIIRIDMSEYTSFDALDKLIGSFQNDKVGILSSRIREQQYGILLLDEFEKSTKEVMDLFLQILDEGFFSDGRGEKINARNLIIIATSNAGSDMIYKAVSEGKDITSEKENIINEIINRGIFRPELLNRFDDVIVFHPLDENQLRDIAILIIKRLNKRLEHKGITIKEDDDLINYLMTIGDNPKFGAREMNRAVQDTIEKLIAESIINGSVKNGDNVLISQQNGILEVKTK